MKSPTRLWQYVSISCVFLACLSRGKPVISDDSSASPLHTHWKRLRGEPAEVRILRPTTRLVIIPPEVAPVSNLNALERWVAVFHLPEILHAIFDNWPENPVSAQLWVREAPDCPPLAVPAAQYQSVRDNMVLYATLGPSQGRTRVNILDRAALGLQTTLSQFIQSEITRNRATSGDYYILQNVRPFPRVLRFVWYLGIPRSNCPPPAPVNAPANAPPSLPPPPPDQTTLPSLDDDFCQQNECAVSNWFMGSSS